MTKIAQLMDMHSLTIFIDDTGPILFMKISTSMTVGLTAER